MSKKICLILILSFICILHTIKSSDDLEIKDEQTPEQENQEKAPLDEHGLPPLIEKEGFMPEVNAFELQNYVLHKKYVLAVFYHVSPQCKICSGILDIMEGLKSYAEQEDITVLKILADTHFELFKSLGFKVLPGVIFFVQGFKPHIYEGELVIKDMQLFFRKMIYPTMVELKTLEDVEEFKKKADYTAIDYSYDHYDSVIHASTVHKHILFAYCRTEECWKEHNPALYSLIQNKKNESDKENQKLSPYEKKTFSLLKLYRVNEEEKEVVLEESTSKNVVEQFFDENGYPDIAQIDLTNIERVGKSGKSCFVVFDKVDRSSYKPVKSILSKLKNNNLIVFYSTPKDRNFGELGKYFGLQAHKLPLVVIFTTKSDGSKRYFKLKNVDELKYDESENVYKYIYEPPIVNEKTLLKFLNDWKYDQLTPEIHSEPITPLSKPLINLVGHNFLDFVMDTDRAVLVKFYGEECPHCTEFQSTYDELAIITKDSEDFFVAAIEVKKNPIPMPIKSLPTMILFNKGPKRPVKFDGDRNLEDLVHFIRLYSNTKIEVSVDDFN